MKLSPRGAVELEKLRFVSVTVFVPSTGVGSHAVARRFAFRAVIRVKFSFNHPIESGSYLAAKVGI